MKIEITDDYDRHDAITDACAWRDVRDAINTVLQATDSLESTGTLDRMTPAFQFGDMTDARRAEISKFRTDQLDTAVATIKRILANADATMNKL